ncbi:Uncharacterised protein [Prevotella disiens]|uniref:Uncharacterized protein n=1 Tax=Prevotella disiens TaxID=28130 RepID=A0A379DYH0_9BACT|nr:Uncharacterised protein [Prevotella disiens]
MLPCRGVIYHVPNTLIFAERNVNRVVEQSEKITPLRLTPLLANEYLGTILKMQNQILNTLQ